MRKIRGNSLSQANRLIILVANFFFLLAALSYFLIGDIAAEDFELIAIFSSINTLFVGISLRYIFLFPFQSFVLLFFVAFTLFHSSPMLLASIFDPAVALIGFKVVDMPALSKASLIYNIAISAYFLGVVGSAVKDFPARVPVKKNYAMYGYLKALGLGLLIVALVAVAVVSFGGSGLSIAYEGGYRDFITWKQEGNSIEMSIFMASLNWLIPWGSVIYLSSAKNTGELVKTLPLIALVLVVMLAAGDRTGPFALVMATLAIFYLHDYQLKRWKFLVLILTLAVGIPAVSLIRRVGFANFDFEMLGSLVNMTASDGFMAGNFFLVTLLQETGLTLQTVMGTIQFVPEYEDFRFGVDYISSLIVAIPFFGQLTDLNPPAHGQWIKALMFPNVMAGPGFSILAESYLQFGLVGVVLIFYILGAAVSSMWSYFLKCTHDPQRVAYLSIIMIALLIWARNDVVSLVRPVVWLFPLLFVLPRILGIKNKLWVAKMEYRS